MDALSREINAMFVAAPRVDDGGCLALAWSRLASQGVVQAFLIDPNGDVVLVQPPQATMDEIALRAIGEFTVGQAHVAPLRLPDSTSGCLWIMRACEGDLPSFTFAAVLDRDPDAVGQNADLIAELGNWGRMVCRTAGLDQTVRELRRRAAQLSTEQHTLRQAHGETVASALSERDRRLQEKRRHIEELEHEVRKRSTALQAALERAEA